MKKRPRTANTDATKVLCGVCWCQRISWVVMIRTTDHIWMASGKEIWLLLSLFTQCDFLQWTDTAVFPSQKGFTTPPTFDMNWHEGTVLITYSCHCDKVADKQNHFSIPATESHHSSQRSSVRDHAMWHSSPTTPRGQLPSVGLSGIVLWPRLAGKGQWLKMRLSSW